jgi:hypothetical protein
VEQAVRPSIEHSRLSCLARPPCRGTVAQHPHLFVSSHDLGAALRVGIFADDQRNRTQLERYVERRGRQCLHYPDWPELLSDVQNGAMAFVCVARAMLEARKAVGLDGSILGLENGLYVASFGRDWRTAGLLERKMNTTIYRTWQNTESIVRTESPGGQGAAGSNPVIPTT